MLFDALADSAFRPLSGKYRHAYASLFRRLNDGLFSVDVTAQPTKPEVLRDLAEGIEEWKAGLGPDAQAEFKLDFPDAYAEMLETGWITEQREGWVVYVEIEERISRLLGCLCGLKDHPPETFGGTMVSVLASLKSAVADPEGAAQGLGEAANRAKEFARYVRGVTGQLKGIEKAMLEQASLNGLVRSFFEDFVGRIVIGDYGNLTRSRNHPYGSKWAITELAEDISSDSALSGALARGLAAQAGIGSEAEAAAAVAKHLRDMNNALEAIEGFRHRIDLTKANVERRFTNALAYMELVEAGRGERFAAALGALGMANRAKMQWDEVVEIPLGLLEESTQFDAGRLAPPPQVRRAVEASRFKQAKPDPLRQAFERAKADFDRRLAITPQRFVDYVEKKIGTKRVITGSDIPPGDVEEMVIFSALLALPQDRIRLPSGVTLRRVRPRRRIQNRFIECDDFVLENVGSDTTEAPDAG